MSRVTRIVAQAPRKSILPVPSDRGSTSSEGTHPFESRSRLVFVGYRIRVCYAVR